ncbi:hypothetical protein B5M43_001600 [Microbacterium sp. MEC084]|uniref:hypothetical protein n=1 Tax=unclassified Microbacterium TaxID=2609290 RepID=UPI0006F3BF5B|nr:MULTISPECIES: hypothetical protein [unclassified Microbacterium]KQZ04932.1 hypothetical protein ASD19_02620 [Microbacterium sp. Root53]MCD1267548.1 hypothetical protein [Microbacterium sp. MEC084]
MYDVDTDGSHYWFEYAVKRSGSPGNAVGPLSRHEAERLAAETGGVLLRRRISQSLWATA